MYVYLLFNRFQDNEGYDVESFRSAHRTLPRAMKEAERLLKKDQAGRERVRLALEIYDRSLEDEGLEQLGLQTERHQALYKEAFVKAGCNDENRFDIGLMDHALIRAVSI